MGKDLSFGFTFGGQNLDFVSGFTKEEMMFSKVIISEKRQVGRLFFWLIFAVCVLARFFKLGEIPLGLNQDEAFSSFEALSLVKNGTDSWGYRYPMYFISWGSGMNALYAYLLGGFFVVFGVNDWVVRLPQAMFGVLSCYVFYRLMSFLYGKKVGLLGFFVVSIVPWHVMLSRWGLEANIMPAFMLLGFYFFARGVKKGKYLPLSGLFYGMALYGYATCWIFVGAVFVICNGYLIWHEKKYEGGYVLPDCLFLVCLRCRFFCFWRLISGLLEKSKRRIFRYRKWFIGAVARLALLIWRLSLRRYGVSLFMGMII